MYIIFDKKGNEVLRYFLDELPIDLKEQPHFKLDSEKDIPKKEGFKEKARLVNDELVWEYDKIEEPIDPKKKMAELESQYKVALMAMMEVNARLRALEEGK